MNFYDHILAVEKEIRLLPEATPLEYDSAFHPARRTLGTALLSTIDGSPPRGHSLPDLIEALARQTTPHRDAAILVLRSLGRPGLLPKSDSNNQMDRKLVELVQKALPDFFRSYKIDPKAQNYINADIIRGIHADICKRLEPLRIVPSTPESFTRTRQEVMKLIGGQQISAYLRPFEMKRITAQINGIYTELELVLGVNDHTFSQKLQALRVMAEDQVGWIKSNKTFLTENFYSPFIASLLRVIEHIDTGSSARFQCEIRSPSSQAEFVLEKRYPLRDPLKDLTVRHQRLSIPLFNSGPGVAINVRASISSGEALFNVPDAHLGDIPPGEFAFIAEMIPMATLSQLSITLDISWAIVSSAERNHRSFSVRVLGQSAEVDWARLEKREPYSTSPAEGAEFVGRKEKVQTLANRLLRERMQSSYITGHKRVGKSSLALAVRDDVKTTSKDSGIHFLYVEYGEIADVDPRMIMRQLGLRIADFLAPHLPLGMAVDLTDFSGSLAPLSRLSDAINMATPTKRFVVILDEFDEIPPELYRSGALAETFFSNLRTLSAKRNLAFMLVGGENMPFIVAAQGDQLNKFVREGLSYFSRADEWSDFHDLVTLPVRPALNWHENAINEVFTVASGHPYYTKLLCAKIYATAVSERDTEITGEEVRRAYRALVSSLDTNSFAHLWKDGISGTREDTEVIALQRCRVLVSLGRTLRAGKILTEQNAIECKYTSLLQDHQIAPILHDFCRRGILRDDNGEYSFTLPLFRDWIAQSGINMLIDDTLGDELKVGLQKAEDAAFVRDLEISSLTETWPVYRSKVIGATEVRQWLGQVSSFRQQRLLFKILQNVRFFSEQELREKLRLAHNLVAQSLPEFVRQSMADRRRDILVTYLDGPAKSGAYYASRYAEENLLASDTVKALASFEEEFARHEDASGVTINGIVIIDDIVGTGNTLSDNVGLFVTKHRELLAVRNLSIIIVTMCATAEGENYLRNSLSKLGDLRIDLRVCEPLAPRHFAFRSGSTIWSNEDEAAEAKTLCRDLGMKITKNAPLGYQDQGLLVAFPHTCPNNSLPILHGSSTREGGWRPLFKRPMN